MSAKPFNVPWNWKQALVVFFAAWIGLPALIVLVLRVLAPVLPPASSLLHGLLKGEVRASFVLLVLDGIAAFALMRHFLVKYKVGWERLGLKHFNLFKASLYILLAGAVFLITSAVLFSLVGHLFPSFNPTQPQVNEFTKGASSSPSLSLIALVFIPPAIEEVVFRGFIFPALADRFGLIAGIVGSSLLFAFAHLQLNVSVYTFVLGCLLCIMYRKTKSIWPGIFLHLLNNYLAFTAIVGK